MNKNNVLILLFVSIIPFIGYLFNPLLAYYDSYAWLGGSCGINNDFVLSFIPCNIFLIKIILLSLYVISIFAISFWGESILGKKVGWRVGMFAATLSPLLFQEAMKFENDIFGWSISFIGLALLGIGVNNPKKQVKMKYMFLGVGTILLSSLFWEGTILLLLALSLGLFWLLFMTIPIVLIKFNMLINYLFNSLNTTQQISEEFIGAGMVPAMFLFPAILDIPKKWRVPGWILFVIGFIKIKYMLFAIPFLALGMVEFENKYKNIKHFPNLVYVCIVFAVVFSFMGFFTAPSLEQFDTINQVIVLEQDYNIPMYNDWQFGWWIEYLGRPTSFKSSYPNPDYNNLARPFLALTKTSLDCEYLDGNNPAIFICK